MPGLVWEMTRSSKQIAPWSMPCVHVGSTPAVPACQRPTISCESVKNWPEGFVKFRTHGGWRVFFTTSYGGGLLSGQSNTLCSVPSQVRKPATIGRTGSADGPGWISAMLSQRVTPPGARVVH